MKRRKPQDLADAFIAFMRKNGVNDFVRDHVGVPGRRFKIDLAHVGKKIAIEIHGATYANGRHSRHAGFSTDLEKARLLTAAGWRCIAFTGEDVKKRPLTTLETIMEIVNAKV